MNNLDLYSDIYSNVLTENWLKALIYSKKPWYHYYVYKVISIY